MTPVLIVIAVSLAVPASRVPAVAHETHICMPVAKPGWYALAIYHDKNNNQKLDKGWFGIPKEMVGLSRNPKFRLRKPHFNEAAFMVPEQGGRLVIRLHRMP